MRRPLTARDRDLLTQLDDFGLMTSQQIRQRLFEGTQIRTVLRRLRILERRRLIQRTTGLSSGGLTWALTSTGLKVRGVIGAPPRVNKNTLEHDILFNTIRLSLEGAGARGSWKSGHSLRQKAAESKLPFDRDENVIPDGIFVSFKNGAMAIAIELELNAKGKYRYRRIFELYSQKKIQLLWYWVPSERLGELLAKQWEARRRRSGVTDILFAWSLIDECLGNIAKLRLRTKDKIIWFKDLVPLHHEKETAHTVAHTVGSLPVSPTPIAVSN